MITVQNLSAGYGKREVLQGMNLSFPAGSMTAVLGPNGSGKTTLVFISLWSVTSDFWQS